MKNIVYNGISFELAAIIKKFQLEGLTDEELLHITFDDVLTRFHLNLTQFCIMHRLDFRCIQLLLKKKNCNFLHVICSYYTSDSYYNVTELHNYCRVSIRAICHKYYLNYFAFLRKKKRGGTLEECFASSILATFFYPTQIAKKISTFFPRLLSMEFSEFQNFCYSDEVSADLLEYMINFYRTKMQVEDALNFYYIADFVNGGYLDVPSMCELTKNEVCEKIGLSREEYNKDFKEYFGDYVRAKCKDNKYWIYGRKRPIENDEASI